MLSLAGPVFDGWLGGLGRLPILHWALRQGMLRLNLALCFAIPLVYRYNAAYPTMGACGASCAGFGWPGAPVGHEQRGGIKYGYDKDCTKNTGGRRLALC